MNQEELEEAFEIEKNNLKVKYLIITVFVAVVVALLSSELSLMYYSNKYVDLSKIRTYTLLITMPVYGTYITSSYEVMKYHADIEIFCGFSEPTTDIS